MFTTRRYAKLLLIFLIALLLGSGGLVGYEFSPPIAQAQGGVTGFANLRIAGFYRAAPRTALTITNGGSLNPTGTYQQVTAAGAVGMSGANITVKPAGTLLILVNSGSNTITFTETGTLRSAGNIALGAADSATLLSDGTNWTQIAASNN